RAVDSQPAFSWLIGGGMMLLHPETKRLGDLVAGTVVVREDLSVHVPEMIAARAATGARPRLEDVEFAALASYVERRAALPSGTRLRIAGKLAESLSRRVEWPRETRSADAYLVMLHRDEAAARTTTGRT